VNNMDPFESFVHILYICTAIFNTAILCAYNYAWLHVTHSFSIVMEVT